MENAVLIRLLEVWKEWTVLISVVNLFPRDREQLDSTIFDKWLIVRHSIWRIASEISSTMGDTVNVSCLGVAFR
jgi:hypothetical protein|tara:strand:- start:4289 stop:4510 length:222 start_codon:yes stop_codon:yes gene_type:complete